MGNGGFLDIIVLIMVFILILVAAYFATKWVSVMGTNLQKNKNVKVLEVFRLSQTKYIYLVKIGDKVSALGVTKDHIEFLCEVKEDSLQFDQVVAAHGSFKEIFNKSKENMEKFKKSKEE